MAFPELRSSFLLSFFLSFLFFCGSLWVADEVSAQEATYLGTEVCTTCHNVSHATFSETMMGRIFFNAPRTRLEARGCEACHGPGSNHITAVMAGVEDKAIITFRDDSPESVAEHNAICLDCHESGVQTHWRGSQHDFADVSCMSCHTIMRRVSPRLQLSKETEFETCPLCHTEQRAQQRRFSRHPTREGKVLCSDCHNPHGGPGGLLVRNTVNETCYQCHAEKRGPYLWEHQPVREDCGYCHDPHGTTQPAMLVVRGPFLCQSCHSLGHAGGLRTGSQLASPASQFTAGKNCMNCHSRVHGSNHPSGAGLTR